MQCDNSPGEGVQSRHAGRPSAETDMRHPGLGGWIRVNWEKMRVVIHWEKTESRGKDQTLVVLLGGGCCVFKGLQRLETKEHAGNRRTLRPA